MWFQQQRSLHVPFSGPILQVKANELAKLLKLENFGCSASWIQRFRQRHGIECKKVSGEAAQVDTSICDKWICDVWPHLRAGYSDDEIFNADEFGFFYRIPPDRTLAFKNEKCSGGKYSKERLTVLVAANMSGTEKRKLLVIGKARKPRCFAKTRIESLPVDYTSNGKAWMTSKIFEETLLAWDAELRRKKKKILLLVDNCPAHPAIKLKFINLVFLPPNTTAVLQPMDQGVIRNVKAKYRHLLVLRVLEDIERKVESKITVLDAIMMVDKAWRAVLPSTIRNCFRHAGFHTPDPVGTPAILEDNDTVRNLVEEDYLCVDDDVTTCEILTDTQIIDAVTPLEDNDSENDEVDDEPLDQPSTISEARAAVRTLELFFLTQNNVKEGNIHALRIIDTSLQEMFTAHFSKQSNITDYFK